MNETPAKTDPKEFLGRLQRLMLIRVIFVSLLLGALLFIQVRQTGPFFKDIQNVHYTLLAIVYFLSLIYVVLLKFGGRHALQGYVQVLLDTAFITAFIYVTGGIESIFSFLYVLNIISGSILLYRRGGLITASAASILYGLLLDLHYYGFIQPLGIPLSYRGHYQEAYVFYTIFANIGAFYLVAYLSSYFTEQTRKSRSELDAKQIDLDKLEGLNESIINSMSSGLIVMSMEHQIILFNPAAEKMFGITAKQARNQFLTHAIPALGSPWGEDLTASSETRFPATSLLDIPYRNPVGKEMILRLSISPLKYLSGEQMGYTLIFQDITRLRHIEDEIKKKEGLAMVGELAATIAHEIRNPMASISGSIQMLAQGTKSPETDRRLMDIISREIGRLQHLIGDFLLFARPGKSQAVRFDLNEVILESLEIARNNHRWNPGIRIVTRFHEPLNIKTDPDQIKQVLWNLFLNAGDAMKHGGVLYVETNLGGRSDQHISVGIRDTGKGFQEEVLAKLFEPFVTTKKTGSGLGLAIVKRIVEGLGGAVSAGNHPEGGAEIVILLPASMADSSGPER